MKTRLLFRIYAVVLGSLLIFALATGALWRGLDKRDGELNAPEKMGVQFLRNVLPPASASPAEQQEALSRVLHGLNVDVTLLDANGAVLAQKGRSLADEQKYRKYNRGALHLPDGRTALISMQHGAMGDGSYFGWAFVGGLITLLLIIGLLAYPMVSRLTRRLEALRITVAQWGKGDVQQRVEVRGHDEIAELASSFNLAAERIEQLITSQKMLLANVSHELRTPLTRMRLNLEMLDGELQTPSSQKRKTDMTRDLIELNQMIESVLVSSRLDAQEKLETEQAVDLLALSHEEASHYDDVRVSGDAAMVRGDAALLRRLLRNLLDNAEKYGAAPIDVRVIEKHNTIEWHVSDSGAGVNVAEPNELFKPFVRASNQHGNQGTGLGLGMVKKIAELHDGSAQVVSKSGEPMHVVVVFAAGLPA